MRALAILALCLTATCHAPPRVVTVVVPYVPVLPLSPSNTRWLGAADCDLQGQPIIWLHPLLSEEARPWVLLHERVHVEQMVGFGGCRTFDTRVRADSMFRLRVEAEAYCNVLAAQRLAHVRPAPSYESIVRQLAEDYSFSYDRDSVKAAMPCSG